jgi:hypothetical protein
MKWTQLTCLVSLAAASPFVARNANPSYDGFQVYSITPESAQEAHALQRRFSRYHTHPIRDSLSVAIPPDEIGSFSDAFGLKARLVNGDLGAYIRSIDAKPSTYQRGLHKRGALPDLSWFDTYHNYTDHLTYWDDLVHAFKKNAKKFEIGKSYENRSIYAYHLFGDKPKGHNNTEKPVVLWHATVHAREVRYQTRAWKRVG